MIDSHVSSNISKGVLITDNINKLRALQKEIKNSLAHRDLDGGAKSAFDHPLFLQAESRIAHLQEELVSLI